ncbi:CoA transferase [Pyruvatibacter sp.]|uniref:CoA transferase n=1 Tax=Pyruvatibacter sp. TaxID=1981328 RepID=UPI003266E4D5
MAGDAFRQVMRHAGDMAGQPLSVNFGGEDPVYPSCIRAADSAAGALGAVSAMAQEIGVDRGLPRQSVTVNTRAAAASLLSFLHMRVDGNMVLPPSMANPTIGIYRAGCGRHIHLHGGFPHLRDGILRLLDCENDETSVADAVSKWDAVALEDALAYMNLCGAVVRTRAEWADHQQGQHLAAAPLVELVRIGEAAAQELPPSTQRPLEKLRILDMTRVLAGPTCGRTLASHGADVLRLGAAHLPTIEPFVMDTGHGKRFATLDFGIKEDAETLKDLAGKANVFVQGYRPGALERHGLGPAHLAELRPGVIYVSVNCYGHEGPMSSRAGWEQLAQSASGMARLHSDETVASSEDPTLFPAAATDYTTGYLAAFGALAALRRQQREGGSWHVRVSLSRTAMWMMDLGAVDHRKAMPVSEEDLSNLMDTRDTPFGEMQFLRPADMLSHTPPFWELPPSPMGSSNPTWR